ncbi:MAG: hypothetical protein RR067_01635 [Bacilli bacterium]
MNKEIITTFNNYYKESKIIDEEFIFEFIFKYIEENYLEDYIKDVTFSTNTNAIAMYYSNNNRINLNLVKILKATKEMLYSGQSNDVLSINTTVLATVIHEIVHAEQRKIIKENSKDQKIVKILKESFKDRAFCSQLYKDHHDYFLIEYNANIEAKFKITEIINQMDNLNKKAQSMYLHDTLMQTYVFDELGVMSPLEKYKIIKKDFTELEDYSNISEYEQILYGLPIKSKTMQKIYDLKKQKKYDSENYFKKI